MNTPNALRESLAAVVHDAWSKWMVYVFEKSTINADGTATIPAWAAERWFRQLQTAYADLSETEKDSDRAEADKYLEVFARHLLGAKQ